MEKRISVGIRESHHRRLGELAGAVPSTISRLMDKALEDFFEQRGAVLGRAAEEGDRAARKRSRQNMKPCHTE